MWYDNIKVTITPNLVILPIENEELPTIQKIKLESHIGFAPNEYNWEVDTNDGNIFTLEKYKGLSSIEVNAYDKKYLKTKKEKMGHILRQEL